MQALLAQSPAAFIALSMLLGLLIGSFLNVVIYRVPLMLDREWRAQCAELAAAGETVGVAVGPGAGADAVSAVAAAGEAPFNLVVPRSACPSCKAPIRAIHNVPVLSWLALRGRCANCQVRISARYPIVELLCGVLSAVVAWKFGFGWQAGAALVITWFLIALTGIDLDHQLLPDSLTLPLLWGGLLASVFWSASNPHSLPVSPSDAIVGAVAAFFIARRKNTTDTPTPDPETPDPAVTSPAGTSAPTDADAPTAAPAPPSTDPAAIDPSTDTPPIDPPMLP